MTLLRSQMTTRHMDHVKKLNNKLRQRHASYRQADIRDHLRCRACQRKRTQHHHIRGRVGPMAEDTSNIMDICDDCHDLRHSKRVLIITGNADSVLRFENTETGQIWDG